MDEATHDGRWRDWIDREAARLLLFARQQTRSEADAEDVLQESMVEAWQRAGGLEPPPLPLVFATIRRRAIDLARSADRRRLREDASAAQAPAWFDAGYDERARREELEAAMKDLPQIHREVLALKVWGGLTFAEIAGVLDIPANTAASRYRLGLEALRKRIGGAT